MIFYGVMLHDPTTSRDVLVSETLFRFEDDAHDDAYDYNSGKQFDRYRYYVAEFDVDTKRAEEHSPFSP